jgi:predicted SnoaL-like aldol condensation-catalyzing enzyme
LFVALPIEAEAQPDENEERKLHMTHKLTPRKQQLAAFYEAFNGNLGALDRILIPDWVSHEPNPGQGKGRQGLKDFIGLVRKSVPDLKVTVEDMIEEGDKIASGWPSQAHIGGRCSASVQLASRSVCERTTSTALGPMTWFWKAGILRIG